MVEATGSGVHGNWDSWAGPSTSLSLLPYCKMLTALVRASRLF